jgi:mannose-6-phosphate isomerase-like protein (cupin superfamily)
MDANITSNRHANTNDIDDEIALLQSMYPDEVTYDSKASQFTFKRGQGKLVLRLPGIYPKESLPDIIAATGREGVDVRAAAKGIIERQSRGEACLDAILIDFIELFESEESNGSNDENDASKNESSLQTARLRSKTMIIWLHHLLATGKRKLAINSQASQINGITKPGYPGVMIFSGPADVVEEHVHLLKQQRWQAFQVRYEEDEVWSFAHGPGIIEVESMGDVVADIEMNGEQRDTFMQVMKIR